MAQLKAGTDGFYHPRREEEVRELILLAKSKGLKIRVRGAGHSVGRAIYTDNFKGREGDPTGIDMMLDQLSFDPKNPNDKVRLDAPKKTVRVKAGCHLGFDPYDPAGVSSWQNSLLFQLDQAGLGVPDVGGIIHQAIGGFISTGSSGGSLQDSFGEAIIGLKLIDGTGKLHELTRASNDDKFFAAGVSLGLLGVITEATFKLVENFNITGEQSTTDIDKAPIDLFGNPASRTGNKPSLQNFLYQKEFPYIRLMWWPQEKVERFVVWKAKRMEAGDYNAATGTPQNFTPQPYWEFPRFGKVNFKTMKFRRPDIPSEGPAELLAEGGGGLFYSIVGNWHQAVTLLKPGFLAKCALKIVAWLFPKRILPAVLNAFNPRDTDPDPVTGQPSGPQKFWDYYWSSLPMDNRVDDKLVPTDFTEIWIPISRTTEVMCMLRDYYRKAGYKATGSFSTELYAAKKSDFWLSPAFGEDMFRVDIFWFGYNADDPQKVYYPQFFKLLMPKFSCRFHWGKYMPVDPNYLRAQYPQWEAFMKLREEMDPQQIFVTHYWRERLGIAK